MYTGTQRTEVFRGQPRRVDFGARLRLEVLAAESDAQRVVEAIRRIPGASTYLQVIDATCFTDFTSLDVNDVTWRRLTREKQHPPFSEKDFNYPERTVVLPPEPGRPWRQGGNPVVSVWAPPSAWEVKSARQPSRNPSRPSPGPCPWPGRGRGRAGRGWTAAGDGWRCGQPTTG